MIRRVVLSIGFMLPLCLFSQFVLIVDSVIIEDVSFILHKKNWNSDIEDVPSITIFAALENHSNDILVFNEFFLESFSIKYSFQDTIYIEPYLENINNKWDYYSDDSLKRVQWVFPKQNVMVKLYSRRFLWALFKPQKNFRKIDYTNELAEILPTLRVCCKISADETICTKAQNVRIVETNLERYYKSTFSRKKFDRLLKKQTKKVNNKKMDNSEIGLHTRNKPVFGKACTERPAFFWKSTQSWMSVDPMADKYPYQSPYVYCGNNPLNIIDPFGLDEWELAKNGTMTKRENGRTDIDIVHGTDKDGNKTSSEFKLGTITDLSQGQGKEKTEDGDKKFDYNYLDIKGDDAGTQFFEFAAQNTDVEWAHIQTGTDDNRIGTAGREANDPTGGNMVKDFINTGVNVRKDIHSHPDMSNIDPNPSRGDFRYATWAIDVYGTKAPPTSVYSKQNGKWGYTPYGYYGKSFYEPTPLILSPKNFCLPKGDAKVYDLKLINIQLEQLLDTRYKGSNSGDIIFIDIKKRNKNEFELKTSSEDTTHLKYLLAFEFKNSRLIGFFQHKGTYVAVFGEKKNVFVEIVGEISPPTFYPIAYKKGKSISYKKWLTNDTPPTRYDGSVWHYIYKDGKMTFDRGTWTDIWGKKSLKSQYGRKYKEVLEHSYDEDLYQPIKEE